MSVFYCQVRKDIEFELISTAAELKFSLVCEDLQSLNSKYYQGQEFYFNFFFRIHRQIGCFKSFLKVEDWL